MLGVGEGNGCPWFFCPQRGKANFHRCAPKSIVSPHTPKAIRRLHSLYRGCLPVSAPGEGQHPQVSITVKPGISEIPVFEPRWLQKLMKFIPSCFPKPVGLGKCSCVYPCTLHSLAFLEDQGSLPIPAPMNPFSAKPLLLTSYFPEVVSSFLLVVQFVLSALSSISEYSDWLL